MTTSVDDALVQATYPRAVFAVPCPLCHASAGQRCQSTGGGNAAEVRVHAKRWKLLDGWRSEMLATAHGLVTAQGRTLWYRLPAGYFKETESWAAATREIKRAFTPKGVPLSEAAATAIERAAENVEAPGVLYASTAHFHGDHQRRQVLNPLERKGVFREVPGSADSYGRQLELTVFGWRVYRQHRRIIRRLHDSVAAEFEAAALAAEGVTARTAQVAQVAAAVRDVPSAIPPKVEHLPAPISAPVPARHLAAVGGNVVDLGAARRQRLNRRVRLAAPPSGGIA